MQITYDSSGASEQWRCSIYSMTAQPAQIGSLFAMAATCGIIFSVEVHDTHNIVRNIVIAIVVCLAFVLLTLSSMVRSRSTAGPRICTTTITPQGIVDVAPNITIPLPWARVREVRCHHGDVFIFASGGGSFIPRSAFPTEAAAQEFCEVARSAKRGDYSRLSAAPMLSPVLQKQWAATHVWPPPPGTGSYSPYLHGAAPYPYEPRGQPSPPFSDGQGAPVQQGYTPPSAGQNSYGQPPPGQYGSVPTLPPSFGGYPPGSPYPQSPGQYPYVPPVDHTQEPVAPEADPYEQPRPPSK